MAFLFFIINRLNHSYLKHEYLQMFSLKLKQSQPNMRNFHSLEIVARGSETQLHVVEI